MEKKPLRAYCNATRYDFNALREFLENRHRVMLVRDCLQIELKEGLVFLFEYGGVVFWSCDYETQKALLDSIAPFSVGILSEVVVDDFEYILEPEASSRIHNDTIRLSEETPLQKLAFSHGIIQSTKLASFENLIQSTIDETRHLPESLAQSGKQDSHLSLFMFKTHGRVIINHSQSDRGMSGDIFALLRTPPIRSAHKQRKKPKKYYPLILHGSASRFLDE